MGTHVIEVAWVVAPFLVWFAVYGVVLLATRPEMPDPLPATQDLGPEPPAIVSLLVNRWDISEDAAESTLLDLGARKFLEFRQPAADPYQTTVHVRDANPTGLSAYERRVLDRVRGLAVDGVVPLTALTFRDQNQARNWAKRLAAEVVADARGHGLSRRRIGAGLVGLLTATAALAGLGVASGAYYWLTRDPGGARDLADAFYAGLGAFIVLSVIAARPHGERDTDAGREVAARWLGVRAWLRGHEAFGDLPPAAIAVWDRYLPYGAAVGATRVASAVIDLGMGNRKRVWSAYGGPGQPASWHRVRVHYPRFFRHYGVTAPRTAIRSAIAVIIGVLLVKFWYTAVNKAMTVKTPLVSWETLIKNAGLFVGFALAVYGSYRLVRTIIDVSTPVTVTGEVVWMELWRSSGDEHPTPILHYLAVDDASGPSTRAWGLPAAKARACADGDTVTIKARRWSRLVTEVHVDKPGGQRALIERGVGDAEQLIGEAMGIPSARSGAMPFGLGILTPITPLGPLLSVEEVGAALGMPVSLHREPARTPVPVEVTRYDGPDGKAALTVVRTAGPAGKMAMRGRAARGETLVGLGDEARGGPGWIIARRGDEVLAATVTGLASKTPPGTFAGLVHQAVSRLPAGVT